MEECIFCKIASGKIPSYKVYESETALAFLDISPCADGHTVIIPKKHFSQLSEMNDGEYSSLLLAVKKASEIIDSKIKPAAMNIGINNRPGSGQAVPHVHWHIIPRYTGDGGGSMHSIVKSGKKENVAEIAKKIQ